MSPARKEWYRESASCANLNILNSAVCQCRGSVSNSAMSRSIEGRLYVCIVVDDDDDDDDDVGL